MLKDILKLTLVLAIGAASIALLFMFGAVVLFIFAITAPIAYLYARFKHPALFAALREARQGSGPRGFYTRTDETYSDNGYGGGRRYESNVIEGEYITVETADDDEKEDDNHDKK